MRRFKFDENMPASAVAVLSGAGNDVATVLEQGLGGAEDAAVLQVCAREDRILVTLDLDFADTRTYGATDSPGIIVMRIPRQDPGLIRAAISRVLPELERESPGGGIWIVEPHRLRIWRAGDRD